MRFKNFLSILFAASACVVAQASTLTNQFYDIDGSTPTITVTLRMQMPTSVPGQLNFSNAKAYTATNGALTITNLRFGNWIAQVGPRNDIIPFTIPNDTNTYSLYDRATGGVQFPYTYAPIYVQKTGDLMTGNLGWNTTTSAGLIVNSLTTTQRNALSATNGMFVYDSTLNQFYRYENGIWSGPSFPSTELSQNFRFIEPNATTGFYPPLTSPNWIESFNGPNGSFIPMVRTDANGNYKVDEDGGSGFVWFNFRPPANATTVTISASLTATGSATSTHFGLRDPVNNILSSQLFTVPSGSWTNVSTNYVGNVNMAAAILPNGGITISNLQITFSPSPTNLALLSAYKRHEVLSRHVARNSFIGVPNGDFQSEESVVTFLTSASVLTLEANTTHASAKISIFTNGVICTNWSPGSSASYAFCDLTLIGTPTRVDVVNSYGASWNQQNSLRAVFCPSKDYVQFSAHAAPRRIWVYGDSIVGGQNWSKSSEDSFIKQMEKILDADVCLFASGGGSLSDDLANRKGKMLRSIASFDPTDIVSLIGRNDWNGSTYANTNQWATNYAAVIDTWHSMKPMAAIYIVTPIPQSSSEAGTGQGSLGTWRTAAANVAATRNFCVTISGPSIMTTADLADGLHPSDVGNGKMARGVAAGMWTFPTFGL
ncbi:MAG: GDSL-like Lipase/Acylhydrolase family [Pedosphaera sp.]|nr:GDSL-like Lipase/Acylhydrolase family [Pedosphaera sp.]